MPAKPQATWLFIAVMTGLSTAAIWVLLWERMFTSVTGVVLACFGVALLVFIAAFLVGMRRKRWDGVDVAWGYTGAAMAIISLILHQGPVGLLQWLVTLAGVLWGVRLGTMILLRQRVTAEQDPRYTKIIDGWKNQSYKNIFIRIYLLQAVLITLVAVPIIHTNTIHGAVFGIVSVVGLFVWAMGYAIETAADYQLAQFKVLSKGKRPEICSTGLRNYSRHPQYFGELAQWWGLAIVSLGTPYGWVGLIGATLISYIVMYISGVPIAEQRLSHKKGWLEYKEHTNTLIPIVLR